MDLHSRAAKKTTIPQDTRHLRQRPPANLHFKKKKHTQAENEWSNILQKSSRARKKPPLHYTIQRPCYQRDCPCQDPAGSRTIRRPPDHRKETQTAVYGHVACSSGLAKTILQGTMKGERRRQGRQKKRWKDSIREWTGLEFAKAQKAVENREKWRKLVVKSSAVPQQPSRLRDR